MFKIYASDAKQNVRNLSRNQTTKKYVMISGFDKTLQRMERNN